MNLPRPITITGFVQFFIGLIIVIDPLNTLSSAAVNYFGGLPTPLFIGVFTTFCGLLILYARFRRYRLTPWKRTLLAAPMLLSFATLLLISRNPLVILMTFQAVYYIVFETGHIE